MALNGTTVAVKKVRMSASAGRGVCVSGWLRPGVVAQSEKSMLHSVPM